MGLATDATVEATEGNNLLLNDNILQKSLGSSKGHTLDSLGGLAGVLKVNSQVASACLARLGGILGLSLVPSHLAGLVQREKKVHKQDTG